MKKLMAYAGAFALAAAGLIACDAQEGTFEQSGERMDRGIDEARDRVDEAGERAGEALDNAGDRMRNPGDGNTDGAGQ
jgi:hypothetical protein